MKRHNDQASIHAAGTIVESLFPLSAFGVKQRWTSIAFFHAKGAERPKYISSNTKELN